MPRALGAAVPAARPVHCAASCAAFAAGGFCPVPVLHLGLLLLPPHLQKGVRLPQMLTPPPPAKLRSRPRPCHRKHRPLGPNQQQLHPRLCPQPHSLLGGCCGLCGAGSSLSEMPQAHHPQWRRRTTCCCCPWLSPGLASPSPPQMLMMNPYSPDQICHRNFYIGPASLPLRAHQEQQRNVYVAVKNKRKAQTSLKGIGMA